MALRLPILVSLTAASVVSAADVTPVEKVITMLEDLLAQVVTEGKAEAKTYDKFACFCKDLSKEKSDAVKDGTDEQEKLQGDLEKLSSKREDLDSKISELEKKIAEVEKKMAEAKAKRKKEKDLYDYNAADMKGALEALEGAIDALKASKPSSLAEIRSVVKTVRRATFMADALGIGGPKTIQALTALLQQNDGVPSEVYEFQSGKIIKTLEDLKKDFESTKDDIDSEEEKAVKAYDKKMDGLKEKKENAEADMEDAKKEKSDVVADIATKSGDLTGISATLLDDQQYLQELAKTCNSQADTWDQRSQARADELSAITEAISIVKGTVSEKTSEKTVRLSQQHVSLGRALSVAANEEQMEALEEDSENVEGGDTVSLVQLGKPRTLLAALAHRGGEAPPAGKDKREQVLTLLRNKSKALKSQLLATLAVQVAADPFAKIKKLIQELIERLLQEAADEGNHKGWCDKETSKAKQKRDYNAEDIVQLNSRLAANEVLRDKLTEEIEILSKELKELKEELDKVTKMRDDEREENEATIKEAEEGKVAVEKAIKVLKDYYDKAKDNKVLMQKGPADDMPDAGFEAGEAYKGAQGASGGIIGMLEVILSDFERTVSVTTKEEQKAQAEFVEFERTTSISIKTKETAKDSKKNQLEEKETGVLAKIESDMEGLESTQDLLNKAIEELQELHEACVDTGMSYEERVEMRENEIESLKEALCILDDMGPMQTESC